MGTRAHGQNCTFVVVQHAERYVRNTSSGILHKFPVVNETK